MSRISQEKFDLAVLLALFEHAERNGEAETPNQIAHMLYGKIASYRISLALEELEQLGEVVREYHPHFSDVGLWQITRRGVAKVEKALKMPNSFIARLHVNGMNWLESDEAINAVLNKISRHQTSDDSEVPAVFPVTQSDISQVVHVNVSPNISNDANNFVPQSRSSDAATWFGSWGTWVAALAAIAAVVVSLYVAGGR